MPRAGWKLEKEDERLRSEGGVWLIKINASGRVVILSKCTYRSPIKIPPKIRTPIQICCLNKDKAFFPEIFERRRRT